MITQSLKPKLKGPSLRRVKNFEIDYYEAGIALRFMTNKERTVKKDLRFLRCAPLNSVPVNVWMFSRH